MRRIVKTEIICLYQRHWHESSKIVTLFSPDLGLVKAVARGARRPKNRFGAALDLFARSQAVLYLKENRDLATLGDTELIDAYAGIALDYNRFLAAGTLARFLLRVLVQRNPEPRLFELLTRTLAALAATPSVQRQSGGTFSAMVGSFILKASAFLGFRPNLDRCVLCHTQLNLSPDKEPVSSIRFDIRKGGLVCPGCTSETKTTLTPEEVQTLQHLLHTPASRLVNVEIPPRLLSLITDYARFHLEISSAIHSINLQQYLKRIGSW
ncbi:MAG: DNA repair protein RecO [bacterium]